jgi:hypothetical protein
VSGAGHAANMLPSMSNQTSNLDSTMDSDRSTASHVSVLSFAELLSNGPSSSNVKGALQPQLSAVPFVPSITSPRDVESTLDAVHFESSCRPTRIDAVLPQQKTGSGYRRLWALVNSVKRGDPVNSRSGADDLSVRVQSVAACAAVQSSWVHGFLQGQGIYALADL